MQNNILKQSNVTKIFIKFSDGKNHTHKESVKLRYMDSKCCYFAGELIANFTKPRWRAKADIIVYTPEGVYSATVIIRETEFSLKNIMYKLDIPKTWKFKQLRSGTRKVVKLPLKLKFNDGIEIEGVTYDLSVGGFSFTSNHILSTVQTSFACSLSMEFPKDAIINFPDGILETSAKYVRQKPIQEGYELMDQKL